MGIMSLAKDYGLLVVLTAAFLVPAATVAPTFKKPVLDFLRVTGSALGIAAGGGVILVLAGGGVLLTEELMRRFRRRGGGGGPPEGGSSPPPPSSTSVESVEDRMRREAADDDPILGAQRKEHRNLQSHIHDVQEKLRKRMASRARQHPDEVEMKEL